jgi:tetratricopeptide (TPR) repeat protein
MNVPAQPTPTVIDKWLSELPRDRARMVYLSAVPLWLDRGILIALFGAQDQANLALDILKEHMLVTSVSRKRAIIRPEARRHLLRAGWGGKLPDHIDANYRIANYCLEQSAQTQEPSNQFRWVRALIYHQIASNQYSGWQQLAQIYEDAEKRGLGGTTLQVLEPLRELRPLLAADDRATLVYYRGRAALFDDPVRKAECFFKAVIGRGRPTTLVGVAHRELGRVFATRQHWTEALKQFRQSEKYLRQSPSIDPLSLALTKLGIGNMYQEMAEFSGGIIRNTNSTTNERWTTWARTIIQFPIFIYKWVGLLIQRSPFIDIGFSYQNWIAARLMLAAETAYLDAIQIMNGNPSPQAVYEARLGLARVYTELGMQRRAENILIVLAQWTYVNESEYRQAQLSFRRAELAQAQQKENVAEDFLQQTIKVFWTYQQKLGLAAVYQRLGNLMVHRGDTQSALSAYRNALELFEQTGQSLFKTIVINQISSISVDEVVDDQREYLAPFPSNLARLYRRLSYFGMALLYFLAALLAFISLVIIFITESAIYLGLISLTIIGLILSWPIIPVWLIQVIYLGIGLLTSFLLPIGILERDPPLRISVNKESIGFRDSKGLGESQILWEDVSCIRVVNYELRSNPIELYSYSVVFSHGRHWQIPAFTTGYVNLSRDIKTHIPPSKFETLTFELITHPLNYLVTFLLLPLGIAFQKAFELGVTDQNDPSLFTSTSVSGAFLGAFIAGLLFFPLTIFWRLVIHQWQLWLNTPANHSQLRPSLLVHFFALLLALLTFLYLHYIYIFLTTS